jgi:hypothetical protein
MLYSRIIRNYKKGLGLVLAHERERIQYKNYEAYKKLNRVLMRRIEIKLVK